MMITNEEIDSLGQRLLERNPNVIVRYRILRDVLHLPPENAELAKAHNRMLSHRWVEELAHEQSPNGTWGRFHSMDSAVKARFPTSEITIRRALALGLEKNDQVLSQAVEYMARVLEGKAVWTDRVEKSEGWPIIVETITAGTLAQANASHPSLRPIWEYWVEIAAHSFPGETYDPSAEWKAHKEQRGQGIHFLRSRYVMSLLGARSDLLSSSLDHQIVDWIWKAQEGIGYLGVKMENPEQFHIYNWLESMEIISHFQSWVEVAQDAINWLLDQSNPDGLWDFGSKVSKSCYFPLSDNWRKAENRMLDHTTRVLALLRKIC